jgi:hypothetical protein
MLKISTFLPSFDFVIYFLISEENVKKETIPNGFRHAKTKNKDKSKQVNFFGDIFDTPQGMYLIEKGKEYFGLEEKTIRQMTPQQLKDL